MKTINIIHVKHDSTRKLAGYYSISMDLKIINEQCTLAEKQDMDIHQSATLVDALGTAALIRYMRCFHGGKRISLTLDEVSTFNEDDIKVHKFFHALRDKHIAHQVNNYEQYFVDAELVHQDGVRMPFETLLPRSERAMLSQNQVWAIGQIAGKVADYVAEQEIEEEKKVLEMINKLEETKIYAFKSRESSRNNVKVTAENVLR